jgi:hypothetical protein
MAENKNMASTTGKHMPGSQLVNGSSHHDSQPH